MQSDQESIQSIRAALDRQPRNRHDAAALGYELLSYLRQHCADDRMKDELRRAFQQYIQRHSFDDLLAQHVEYARRIALSAGDLLYEEMLKLFYLCDEIKALSSLGFVIDATEEKALADALRERFAREPRKSQTVAEQNVELWKSDWWWYECNLKGKGNAGLTR